MRSKLTIDREVFPQDPLTYARGDTRNTFDRRLMHELARDFTVYWNGRVWTVPEGFYSDGASIPRIAYSLAGGPYSDTSIYAAFLHDWLYCVHARNWMDRLGHLRHHERGWRLAREERDDPMTKREVDRLFHQLLPHCGQPKYRAAYFYAAVRANLIYKWRDD